MSKWVVTLSDGTRFEEDTRVAARLRAVMAASEDERVTIKPPGRKPQPYDVRGGSLHAPFKGT